MSAAMATLTPPSSVAAATGVQKKPISWSNIALGGCIQLFEVSTLGQPLEVLKTHMAAHRGDGLATAVRKTYGRGGLKGFYQGLIPWAVIEASTKGAVLLFVSSEVDYSVRLLGYSPVVAGLFGGMAGGIGQAYTTMGFCTFMKTVEVTRQKTAGEVRSTMAVAYDILKREGILGMNRGVTAVALRQMTNWGSRFAIARVTENILKGKDKNRKLATGERILASVIGGGLAVWNQPLEVIRVEMQSQSKNKDRLANAGFIDTAKNIYRHHGLGGFYRGVTPRIMLSVYLTCCMVFGGDTLKEHFAQRSAAKRQQ